MTSWRVNNVERMFLSGNDGGCPIVFPNFASDKTGGNLPFHGFAKEMVWQGTKITQDRCILDLQ